MHLTLRRMLQEATLLAARPYIVRELPAWGRLFALFGSYRHNELWKDAGPRLMRGKMHGYLMHLDLAKWTDRTTYFLGRWYDIETQLFAKSLIREGDTVVDIGANRGDFALFASRLVGEKGRVICFEPNPEAADLLALEIETNGIRNIVLHRVGLGETAEALTLSVPLINSGEGTFGQSAYEGDQVRTVVAQVRVGDEMLAQVKPALIKIDVEGFECNVIAGLTRTLTEHKPVVITEIISEHLQRAGSSVESLWQRMRGMGYLPRRLGWKRRGLRFESELLPMRQGDTNCDAVWHPIGESDVPELRAGSPAAASV